MMAYALLHYPITLGDTMPIPVAMTIAGSDPSGGAGLQADLKTFHQHGVYGASVVTLLTVQNTQTVSAVHPLVPDLVTQQFDAVVSDLSPAATKTGALGNRNLMQAVASRLHETTFPIVVDPVMISKHKVPLMDETCIQLFTESILPSASLVTPNLFEATKLAGVTITDLDSMKEAASKIRDMGAEAVLIKGLKQHDQISDLLLADEEFSIWNTPVLDTPHTHGTGCVLSAAVTARIAKGTSILQAVEGAKRFITHSIQTAPGLGHGVGPVNLFAPVDP